ncbi:peptidase S8/S53 domain-containing protein [Mycena epipterygia]|nr:peptidase S8/S53 domain-containing protein [Mycena epipterygia]
MHFNLTALVSAVVVTLALHGVSAEKPSSENPGVASHNGRSITQLPLSFDSFEEELRQLLNLPEQIAPYAASSMALICVKETLQPQPQKAGDAVPNHFFVRLKPGVDYDAHLREVKALFPEAEKCDKIKPEILMDGPLFKEMGYYGGLFGPSLVAAIKKMPGVESVEPDTIVEAESCIPDPNSVAGNVTVQEHFPDTTWNLNRLNTREAAVHLDQEHTLASRNWPFTTIDVHGIGQEVNVYVIDSGVNDHPDLEGRIFRIPKANVIEGDNPEDTMDTYGHGTAVAGLIAGKVTGVGKYATIIPVKVMHATPGTTGNIVLEIIRALEWKQLKGGLTVINLSVGLGNGPLVTSTIALAFKRGAHIVKSAGNTGLNECATTLGDTMPDGNARVNGPITVGGTTYQDRKVALSNFGPCLTVYAPGQALVVPSIDLQKNPDGFESFTGTSGSAALTSGLVATILAVKPGLTPEAMKAEVKRLAATPPNPIYPGDMSGSPKFIIQVPVPPPKAVTFGGLLQRAIVVLSGIFYWA